jgi:tRNA 2-thiocytidine biosynthesis protein TtcA
MDRNLFPFATLQPTGVADPGGDRAFDVDEAEVAALSLSPRRGELS